MNKTRIFLLNIINVVSIFCCGIFSNAQAANTDSVKIRLVFDNNEAVVALENNNASKDFISLLPLNLIFEDYNNVEKISMLPRKLNTNGSPSSCDPDVGTFAYYAPWGNLSIFYQDFRHSNGLVPLGQFESGIKKLGEHRGKFAVRIELMQ